MDKALVLADRLKKLKDQVDSLATKQTEIQTIKGDQGPKGEQGDRGFDGAPGLDGRDGKDGKDGADGKDGVSVVKAEIAFDGSLVLYLSNGDQIDCGEVTPEKSKEVFQTIKNSGGSSPIDIFTAVLPGLVPASGGGTTNFLRADGTFAAPPSGSPASPTTSVQFNNAGAFGGSANFTYISGTNTLTTGNITGSALGMTIQPLAPTSGAAGNLILQARSAASGNSSGGGVILNSGNSTGIGSAGEITFQGGSSPSNIGALFVVSGGTSGESGGISSGAGYAATGVGGDFLFYLGGGATDDGNFYFQDSGGSNFIHCKTATPAGAQQIGFFNATPVAKPAPTASGTGNVLSSVVTALNSLGLVDSATLTDSAANFTDVAQGLVPASGGGTANFLRADGTFAAPTATVTPAGADTQIQYNAAGVLGASANFTYSSALNTLSLGPATGTATFTTRAPSTAQNPSTLVIAAQNSIRTAGTSPGGALTLRSGNGRPTGLGNGGAISITSGTGGLTGNGGAINITAGNSTATSNLGGALTLRSGNGGNLDAFAGDNNAGDGGSGTFRGGSGGDASNAGNGGGFSFVGGQAVGTFGNGGSFSLAGGGASAGGGNGGSCSFSTGFSGSAAYPDGDISFALTSGGLPGSIVFINNTTFAFEITRNSGTGATEMGFFNAVPVGKPTAVPVTAAGIHAALVSLGLIS